MKKRNYLLWAAVALVIVYWLVAPLVPRPFVRNMVSILSLVATVLLIYKFSSAAWGVLVRQDRDESGAHYAILGAVTSSIGVAWTGLFSMIWIYFGQPMAWSATATSSFGFALIAVGKWLMWVSPDSVRADVNYPIGFWRLVLAAFSLVLAYLAGAYFSNL